MSLHWLPAPFNDINSSAFRFHLKARDPLVLPAYKGSTLRGGFGYAFKRVVCALKNQDCAACLLKEKCIYSYVFETPPPANTQLMRKYKAAPHPFIIESPLERQQIYRSGTFLQGCNPSHPVQKRLLSIKI